jgi:hypothetical protein
MDDTRYHETALLPAGQMLAVLATVAADPASGLASLAAAGLRVVRYRYDNKAYLLIPETGPSSALIAELEAAGCKADPAEPIPDAHSHPGFAAGVAALLHATAVAPDSPDAVPGGIPGGLADPLQDEALVVVAGAHDRLQALSRALTVSVPASRVDGYRNGDEEYLVFRAADNPNLASTLGGFAAGPWGRSADYFECFSAGSALVCFNQGLRPPKTALRACARIFQAVLGGGADHRTAFAVDAAGGDAVAMLRFDLPRRTLAALESRKPGLQVVERALVNDSSVIERLRRSIAAAGDGYAVRLDRLPAAARTRSPESIREEIARLEAEWQIAVGLQQPQIKLLRFDHTQVRAMVDALRRIPIADIHRVQYAFSAAADRAAGYHYLKYTTRDVQPLQPFIECIWREACGGGPIVHWIDPAWATIYQDWNVRQDGSVRSLVMVPEDHVFSPAFYSFTKKDMDRHLWETIAAWSADARGMRDRQPPPEPIYLFSPLTVPPAGGRGASPARVRVEILDGTSFTAITGQIGFINRYLLVADHIDIADFIRTGAAEARRRAILDGLRADASSRARELNDLASDLESKLEAQLGNYLALLNREVELLGRSIEAQGVQVERLTLESEIILQHVADACGERAALKFEAHRIPGDFAPVAGERAAIETGLARVITATNDTIENSSTRLQDARRRLAELESKLRRGR